MKDLARFATEDYPLHPSGLGILMQCPWRIVMDYLFGGVDEGGQAGDTGSATHVAVASMHKGKELADCVKDMQARVTEYPKADLSEAAGMFLAYASDSRQRQAKAVLVEENIAFTISPAPEDPTQAGIQIRGRLDQVREERDGKLRMWDLKTSKRDPVEILNEATLQVAAYCVGASIKLGKPVHPGGVIMPRKYGAKDFDRAPVMWSYPWTFDDLEQVLDGVRHLVALIRSGKVWHIPNAGCRWCIARSPDLCLPKLQHTLAILRPVVL